MKDPSSNEEIFLQLMREETRDNTLSLQQALEIPLAKTLLRTIQKRSEPQQVQDSRREPKSLAESQSALPDPTILYRTAIQDTFNLGELRIGEVQRAALASHSDLVMIEGQRRLRLNEAKRAEILDVTAADEPYKKILQEAVADDVKDRAEIQSDAVRSPSAWVRSFLTGDFPDIAKLPPRELKAALQARESLRLVKSLPSNVPSLDDIARRVELAELLDPLRLLIGAEGGWDGVSRRDRFVGREEELRKLRAFVDELSSQGILEAVSRFASSVKQAVTRSEKPGIMVIQARGGLGKSTLLAKFVLDHALGQDRPFPFAYLDFDRASLDPERPLQLLIEIVRQVGLQFPPVQPDLNRVADRIRTEFIGSRSSNDVSRSIRDPFAAFVEILRERVTFTGSRAFLLVLDTMEVVQWDSAAVDKLASFLREFRAKGLEELKVVVSGRADVPELRQARGSGTATKNLVLQPLQVQEAASMAQQLGTAAIGTEWNARWSSIIAGNKEDRTRREPLAVRVAVDLIAHAKPEDRPKLVDEISSSGLDANDDFVARIYFKRIVNHVRDPLAQKLAWPGLVVRRVSVELIRELLAPFCEIRSDQAEAAFKSLSQEVWMVTREGDALKHRQDLRARTLPLMKNAEPKKFDEIARKAVDYYAKYRTRSAEDRAEWIYHRLLSGEPPQAVWSDMQDEFLPLLARASEDFPPNSAAASYLLSRTATSRLSPPRIRGLISNDALYHLTRTASSTFALDDVSLDQVALEVSKRINPDAELAPGLEGWARALWIKTGAWQKVAGQDIRVEALEKPLLRAHLFWAARIGASLPAEQRDQMAQVCIELCLPELESAGVRSVVQLLALARMSGLLEFELLDRAIANMLERTKPNSAPSTQAAVRTANVLGNESRVPAVAIWLSSRRRGSSDRVQEPSLSLAEIKTLMKFSPEAERYLARFAKEANESPARFTDFEVVTAAESIVENMVYDGGELSGQQRSQALPLFFACRDEDWIVPIGYAAQRAYGRPLSKALSRSLAFYGRCDREAGSEEPGNDMVVNMRLADEAADLPAFAARVFGECDPKLSATEELRFLLRCQDAWRRAISSVVGAHEIPEDVSKSSSSSLFSGSLGKIRDSIKNFRDVRPPLQAPKSSSSDRPPDPGPILDFDDPQKGRWGGQNKREGRSVRVAIDSVEGNIFYFSVIVDSTDGTPLAPPVVFHLHDSYPRSVVSIRRIQNQQAILREWNSYGVFAIGVQVKNAAGQWISLEIDLANVPGLPKRFLKR